MSTSDWESAILLQVNLFVFSSVQYTVFGTPQVFHYSKVDSDVALLP